jgi:hypothetical protein
LCILSPTALKAAKWIIPSIVVLSKKVFISFLTRKSMLWYSGFLPVISVILSKTFRDVFDKSSIITTLKPAF